MITGRDIEFTLSLKDSATPQYYKFVDEVRAGSEDVKSSMQMSNKAFEDHGKFVNKVKDFYKEQRGENRLMSFYFREGRDAVNALSFGLMSLIATTDNSDESQKRINKSLAEGMAAFQGIEFTLSLLGAGPWGLVAGGIIGVATAVKGLVAESENIKNLDKGLDLITGMSKGMDVSTLKEALNIAKELEYIYQTHIDLAKQRKRNPFVAPEEKVQLDEYIKSEEQNLQMAKKIAPAIKSQIELEEVLQKARDVSYRLFKESLVGSIAGQKILIADLEKDYERTTSAADRASKYGEIQKAKNELLKMESPGQVEVSLFEKLWWGNNVSETLGKIKNDTGSFAKDTKKMFGGEDNPTKSAESKQYQEAMRAMSEMERRAFREDKDYELQVVDDWLAKVKATNGMTQDDITRAEGIAAERRSQIEIQSFQKTFSQYSSLAIKAFSLMQRASNQRFNHEIDEIETKKEKELEAIDKALKAGNLSAEQKKRLEAEKEKITKKYADQEAEIKRQQWEADKEARLRMAIIEGAEAVVKALPNIPLAVIAGAMAAAEIAVIQSEEAPKFHGGGEMDYSGQRIPLANDERPAVLKVGETVRTPEQEKNLQRGGNTFHFHFPGVVTNEEGVVKVIKSALEKSGFNSLTDLITNDRRGYSFGTVK